MNPGSLEAFSRLVAGVYAAAVEPRQWQSALAEINRRFDGVGTALVVHDSAVAHGPPWYVSTLPAESGEAYRQYYHRLDRVAETAERGPVGVVRTGAELMPLVRHSEFSDWLRPHDIDDVLVVRLGNASRPACLIQAASRRTEPYDAPELVKLMNGLIPHLQQALFTLGSFADAATSNADLAAAMDTVRHASIIVGRDASVLHLNSAAEGMLRAEDGLRVRSGHLAATSPTADHHLRRALHDALSGGAAAVDGGRTFACERPSGRRPYLVQVLPLRRRPMAEAVGGPRALVLIRDPSDEPRPAAALLRQLFGLTAAEAHVALGIARGADLKEICDDLSVSITTVRKHLQHVFDKTDTHRQAELVRLLLTLQH